MNEKFLHYLWQTKQINLSNLCDTEGNELQIIHWGTYNTDGGPDFINGKIGFKGAVWAGNIELHVKSTDWDRHRHSSDKKYGNVVLHVVWEHDGGMLNFPTLELNGRVPGNTLSRYKQLNADCSFIPCEKLISGVDELVIGHWQERLLIERFSQKLHLIRQHLLQSKNSWEEVFWWMIARNFGITANADAFEQIAKFLPLKILAKTKGNLLQVEALLLGLGGLLDGDFADSYPKMLQKEFAYLQKKFSLIKPQLSLQFLRMRPANFPTIRLSQLAALIYSSTHLFSKMKEAASPRDLLSLFNVSANDYWHYHYLFDDKAGYRRKTMGKQMQLNILINTALPLLFAYGFIQKDEALKAKSIAWLEALAPEANKITKGFQSLSIVNKSAYNSQSLIQLYKHYCTQKKCLQCAIGNNILKKV